MQLYSLQDFKKDIMVPISGAPPVDVALNRLKRAPADACVEHEGYQGYGNPRSLRDIADRHIRGNYRPVTHGTNI